MRKLVSFVHETLSKQIRALTQCHGNVMVDGNVNGEVAFFQKFFGKAS